MPEFICSLVVVGLFTDEVFVFFSCSAIRCTLTDPFFCCLFITRDTLNGPLLWQLASILSTPIASLSLDPTCGSFFLLRALVERPTFTRSFCQSDTRILFVNLVNPIDVFVGSPCRSSTSTRSIHRHAADPFVKPLLGLLSKPRSFSRFDRSPN